MMNDSHDQLLDAFLAEAIRGDRPPDVAGPVLAAWRKQAETLLPENRRRESIQQAASASHRSWWFSLAGIVILGFSLGLILLGVEAWQRQRTAERAAPMRPTTAPPAVPLNDAAPGIGARSAHELAASDAATLDGKAGRQWPQGIVPGAEMAGANPLPQRPAVDSTRSETVNESPLNGLRVAEPANLAALVEQIDQALASTWQEVGLAPAERISRPQWAERVVTTFLPNVAERDAIVGMLLTDTPTAALERFLQTYGAECSHELARRIAARLLAGRHLTQPAAAENLQGYLARCLQQQTSWSTLVANMLNPFESDQSPTSSQPNVAGADAWLTALTAAYGARAPNIADHVSRTFLQRPLGCARCHDFSTTEGVALSRQEFWQFQAYFQQLGLQLESIPPASSRLVKQDYLPDGRPNDSDAPVFFEQPDGRLVAAYPGFEGIDEASHSGLVREFDRLQRLAQHVSTSQACAASGVDWVWESLLGFPLVAQPGVWPTAKNNPFRALRDTLADDLVAHQDLSAIVRAVVLSEAFWRGTSPTLEPLDQPLYGTLAYFSRHYPRLPRELSVDGALAKIEQDYQSGAGSLGTFARIANLADRSLTGVEMRPEYAPAPGESIRGSLPDSARDWGVPEELAALLQQIAVARIEENEKIRHIFWIGLNREPSPQELQRAKAILVLSQDSLAGFRDIWGSILLSNEVGSR